MKIAVFILAGLLLALAVWTCWIRLRRKRQMNELIRFLTKAQDTAALPEMEKIAEGQMGILQSEIYKVVTILKGEYSVEYRQKKYISDMMADISHQFKTPLQAISLMSELLMQQDVAEEDRLEYAAKIEQETGRMTWLIRSLLTLSQMEAGVLTLKKELTALGALLQEVTASLKIMAEAAEVELQLELPEQDKPAELMVQADARWLTEAVSNLVKNAVEHTPAGGWVKVSAGQNNLVTLIRVEDNGTGIQPKDLPHIFERFYRAGGESAGSIGIGLAIAKQVVQLHDGTIEVQSEAGQGTVFIIKLYRS